MFPTCQTLLFPYLYRQSEQSEKPSRPKQRQKVNSEQSATPKVKAQDREPIEQSRRETQRDSQAVVRPVDQKNLAKDIGVSEPKLGQTRAAGEERTGPAPEDCDSRAAEESAANSVDLSDRSGDSKSKEKIGVTRIPTVQPSEGLDTEFVVPPKVYKDFGVLPLSEAATALPSETTTSKVDKWIAGQAIEDEKLVATNFSPKAPNFEKDNVFSTSLNRLTGPLGIHSSIASIGTRASEFDGLKTDSKVVFDLSHIEFSSKAKGGGSIHQSCPGAFYYTDFIVQRSQPDEDDDPVQDDEAAEKASVLKAIPQGVPSTTDTYVDPYPKDDGDEPLPSAAQSSRNESVTGALSGAGDSFDVTSTDSEGPRYQAPAGLESRDVRSIEIPSVGSLASASEGDENERLGELSDIAINVKKPSSSSTTTTTTQEGTSGRGEHTQTEKSTGGGGERQGESSEQLSNLRKQWMMYLGQARTAEDALKLITKYKKPLATWQLVIAISAVAKCGKKLSSHELQSRVMQSSAFHRLTAKLEEPPEDFTSHGLSHTLWSYAKLGSCPTRLFNNLTARVAKTVGDFNSRDLATTMWAYGTLHHCPKKVMKLLKENITEKASNFNSHDLANTLWSCAKLSNNNKKMLAALSAQVMHKVDEFKPQELSNAVWAYATLQYLDTKVLDVLVKQAELTLPDFSAQAISNTLWGFATLKYYPHSGFLEQIGAQIVNKISFFTAQNLANTLWAFTNLKYYDEQVVECILLEVMGKLWIFECQHLASTLWSMARLVNQSHVANPDMLYHISQAIGRKVTQFLPMELANILWAYAMLNHNPGTILYDMTHAVEKKLERFRPQELANVVWGLAKLGHHPGAPFLQRVAAQIGLSVPAYRTQDLASTVWAYATFGLYPEGLVPALTNAFKAKVHEATPQALANFVWALITLGVVNSTILTLLVECSKVVHELENASKSDDSRKSMCLVQLFQTWLAFSTSAPDALVVRLHHECDLDAMNSAFNMWRSMQSNHNISGFQYEVSYVLDRLQIPHQHEFLSHNGLFSVDIAVIIPHKNLQIAIEVDGPTHFTVNTQEPKGKTLLRNRILLNSGWVVICVPFFEWHKSLDANVHYMQHRLGAYVYN